jgi:hypothetical protein
VERMERERQLECLSSTGTPFRMAPPTRDRPTMASHHCWNCIDRIENRRLAGGWLEPDKGI